MELPQDWSEEAYAAMLRFLQKRFGQIDLVYEVAADRWLEVREKDWPTPGSAGELVGLCMRWAYQRALSAKRAQARVRCQRLPLEDVADWRAEPDRKAIQTLLKIQNDCLERLPTRRQRLLSLYYEQNLSDNEIAQQRLEQDGWEGLPAKPKRPPKAEDDPENLQRTADARRVWGEYERKLREWQRATRRLEAARKAVSRERKAAAEELRLLVEAEAARVDCSCV